MITFIKAKLKNYNDQKTLTNMEQLQILGTEYHIISKSMMWQLFYVKYVYKNVKNHYIKMDVITFSQNIRVTQLSKLYPTVRGITIPSFKSI